MRPIRETLPLDEAMALVLEAAAPIDAHRAPVASRRGRPRARGRRDRRARCAPFDRAAMDGYAVIAADTFGAGTLRAEGRCVASRRSTPDRCRPAPSPRRVRRDRHRRTDASGADAVVMVEETEKGAGGTIRIFTPVYPRQHVGRKAADIAAGQTIARGRAPSSTQAVSARSRRSACSRWRLSLGRASRFSRPATRSSSRARPLAPGQIYDVNQFALGPIVEAHGGIATHGPAGSRQPAGARCGDACGAAEADIVVFSGGSSVGERDLILDAMQQTGEIIFHGIAVKPGKPTVFGGSARRPVFGLPGYPTSCLSNAYMLLVPMLRRMARLARVHAADRLAAALATRRLDDRPAPVLHGRIEDGKAVPAFKGVGRHHQHVARRRLLRNPRADRHRRSRRARRREAVLMARPSALATAPPFELPTQKGDPHTLAEFLARGPVLLAFHRGTW